MSTPVPNLTPDDKPAHNPGLTDYAALERQRNRARRNGNPVDFLHRIARDEIKDRLAEVNRSFTDPAIVTGWPEFWADLCPGARIVPDHDHLGLTEGAHDLVIHAMALHWADDPVGQIIQSARALRPDGLFIAVMPGGETLAGLRAALLEAEVAITGGLSPRILPMAEIRDLGGLLSRGGLALPVADLLTQMVSYKDSLALMHDLRAMGEGNALAGRLRHPTRREILNRAAQIYAERHPDPDNPSRILARFDLIFLTGWTPADNQQKPLRPGSAKMSLAEALNTKSTS